MTTVKKNKSTKTLQKKVAGIKNTSPNTDSRVNKKLKEINKMLENAVFLES